MKNQFSRRRFLQYTAVGAAGILLPTIPLVARRNSRIFDLSKNKNIITSDKTVFYDLPQMPTDMPVYENGKPLTYQQWVDRVFDISSMHGCVPNLGVGRFRDVLDNRMIRGTNWNRSIFIENSAWYLAGGINRDFADKQSLKAMKLI